MTQGLYGRGALALAAWLMGSVAYASSLSPNAAESAALSTLAQAIPGARVVWVRGERIFEAAAASGFTAELKTQGNIVETNPRFSPDGSQILTVRSDGVYLMKSDFTQVQQVIAGGSTASWTRDGKSITAVDGSGYKVVQYDLASEVTTTIYDAQQSPYNGQQVSQAAELRSGGRFLLVFRALPSHVTEIVDLQLKTYIKNEEMARGDCSPAWAPDGSFLITTARTTSRPVLRASFTFDGSKGAVTPSSLLVGLDTSEKFYIHGQRVANSGQYLAFGGKIFAGPLTSALREIYIWRIGDADGDAVRISFDTAEDEEPDLYLPVEPSPAGDLGSEASGGPVPEAGLPDARAGLEPQPGSDGTTTSDAGPTNRAAADLLSGGCAVSQQAPLTPGLLFLLPLLPLLLLHRRRS